MEIETKEVVTVGGWLLSMGGLVAWVKIKIRSHDKDIKAIKDLFVTSENEPRLMTYTAHDKVCARQQERVIRQNDRLDKIVEHQEKQDDKLEKILVAVTELKSRP